MSAFEWENESEVANELEQVRKGALQWYAPSRVDSPEWKDGTLLPFFFSSLYMALLSRAVGAKRVVLGYNDKVVKLVQAGSGGLSDFQSLLHNDDIFYVVLAVDVKDQDEVLPPPPQETSERITLS